MSAGPPPKRAYDRARLLGPSDSELSPEQEQRRQLLRDCINGCDPRLSDIQFAKTELFRHPRTVRRWLAGEHPIPVDVAVRLKAMREYQKRKAREKGTATPEQQAEKFSRYIPEFLPIPPGAPPPVVTVLSSPRHESPKQPTDQPKRKYVPAIEQLAAAQAARSAAADGSTRIGRRDARTGYWRCQCPESLGNLLKMRQEQCARCKALRPE